MSSFSINNPLKCPNIIACLSMVQTFIVQIMTPIAVLAMLYAGFLYLTAQGNQQKLTMARNIILYVAVGSIIIGVATGVNLLVKNMLS